MMLLSRRVVRSVTALKFSGVSEIPHHHIGKNLFNYPSFSTSQTLRDNIMDAKELIHFLADSPPSAVRLEIKPHFEALSEQQKRYAHYISRYMNP